MIWAFVDYENVGSLESLDLEKYQRLIIFCGPRHRKLNLGEIPTSSFCHLELIRMASTGNNNLDFHLAFYLGLHHLKAGKEVKFEVISNDKGFDGVIAHLTEMGRKCSRVGRAKRKVAKKVVAKKVVAEKVAKKVVAKKVVAKKVAKKASVQMPLSNKNDLESGAEAKPILANRKSLARIREAIKEKLALSELRNLPSSQDELLNWIENKISGESVTSVQVFDSLKGVGCVDATEDELKYDFGDKAETKSTEAIAKIAAKNKNAGRRKYTSIDVSKMLEMCPGRSRPRRQDKLVNWISDRLGDEKIFSLDLYEDLLEAGIVIESNGAVSYDFKLA